MKKLLLSCLVVLSVVVLSMASTPNDTTVLSGYGTMYTYPTDCDTIKSATDSAVIKSIWTIPASQKKCVYSLFIPKIRGTGNDSVKAYLGITGYDKYGNRLFRYVTPDTIKDSVAGATFDGYRFRLPVETPLCAAEKYRLVFYGYTGAGGQAIIPAGIIAALKPSDSD